MRTARRPTRTATNALPALTCPVLLGGSVLAALFLLAEALAKLSR